MATIKVNGATKRGELRINEVKEDDLTDEEVLTAIYI